MSEWIDDSVYPGTDVLVNKLGIRDQATLTRVENRLVQDAERALRLADNELLTPAAVAKTHGELFGDLYEWAGKHRTVNISKGGTHFLPADRIGSGLTFVIDELRRAVPPTVLKDIEAVSREDASAAAAQLARLLARPVAELNYVHPFREGNGRVVRAYVDQIAGRAGLRLDAARIERLPWNWASKVSAADPSQTLGIKNQLRDALVPRERQRQRQADRPGPPGRDAGRAQGPEDSLDC